MSSLFLRHGQDVAEMHIMNVGSLENKRMQVRLYREMGLLSSAVFLSPGKETEAPLEERTRLVREEAARFRAAGGFSSRGAEKALMSTLESLWQEAVIRNSQARCVLWLEEEEARAFVRETAPLLARGVSLELRGYLVALWGEWGEAVAREAVSPAILLLEEPEALGIAGDVMSTLLRFPSEGKAVRRALLATWARLVREEAVGESWSQEKQQAVEDAFRSLVLCFLGAELHPEEEQAFLSVLEERRQPEMSPGERVLAFPLAFFYQQRRHRRAFLQDARKGTLPPSRLAPHLRPREVVHLIAHLAGKDEVGRVRDLPPLLEAAGRRGDIRLPRRLLQRLLTHPEEAVRLATLRGLEGFVGERGRQT